jgi:hypothetical protein
MNDNELMTVLREQRGTVPMTTPVEQIISRGRAVRARHRIPRVAAAVGAAAAVAVAVSMALPASHPVVSHPASRHAAQLAAWIVTRQADGSIQVTFREATDPAGLQRTLRADGVPVSVTFTGQQNPACQSISPGPPWQGPLTSVMGGEGFNTPYALVIHPSDLPPGDGLQIWTSGSPGAAHNFQLHVDLVQASPQCTGS